MINDLRLDGSFLDYAVQIGVLLGGILLATRLERRARFGFLVLAACIWTYHVMYDFVVLPISLTLLADAPLTRSRAVNWIILIILVAGMTRRIYFGPKFTEIGA